MFLKRVEDKTNVEVCYFIRLLYIDHASNVYWSLFLSCRVYLLFPCRKCRVQGFGSVLFYPAYSEIKASFNRIPDLVTLIAFAITVKYQVYLADPVVPFRLIHANNQR